MIHARALAATLTATVVAAGSALGVVQAPSAAAQPSRDAVVAAGERRVPPAKTRLGKPRSGQPWLSGAWTGGRMTAARTTQWGTWRGSAADLAQTYPERRTWAQIEKSTWHIDTYKGFRGKLLYGLPLLPSDGSASLADVAAGKHDAVFRKVARDLASRGRADTIVRVGWEANGDWYPWSATASNAAEFKGAFRRVAKVFRGVSPKFVIDFDVSAGFPLRGQSNRLDALTKLYPGDDVVDVIGVDTYDWNATAATANASWARSVKPANVVGIADVAAFARARGKGFAVPEWGLAQPGTGGNGDNPFYIRAMRNFFMANRDILVAENYFNEPDPYIANSLWAADPQNPKAAAVYRKLW